MSLTLDQAKEQIAKENGWDKWEHLEQEEYRGTVISMIEKAAMLVLSSKDKELKHVNDFICDIAKLLGEDDLGLDGKTWGIDDFKYAIDLKDKEIAELNKSWINENDLYRKCLEEKSNISGEYSALRINSLGVIKNLRDKESELSQLKEEKFKISELYKALIESFQEKSQQIQSLQEEKVAFEKEFQEFQFEYDENGAYTDLPLLIKLQRTKSGIDYYIKSLREEMKKKEEGKWIKFPDNQPEFGKGVLVLLDNGFITSAYRKEGTPGVVSYWQIMGPLDLYGVDKDNQVTHWRHFPEPPKF